MGLPPVLQCKSGRWVCVMLTCLQGTSVQQLTRGLHNLKLQLSEHTGQLKALVRWQLLARLAPGNPLRSFWLGEQAGAAS